MICCRFCFCRHPHCRLCPSFPENSIQQIPLYLILCWDCFSTSSSPISSFSSPRTFSRKAAAFRRRDFGIPPSESRRLSSSWSSSSSTLPAFQRALRRPSSSSSPLHRRASCFRRRRRRRRPRRCDETPSFERRWKDRSKSPPPLLPPLPSPTYAYTPAISSSPRTSKKSAPTLAPLIFSSSEREKNVWRRWRILP